MYKNCFCLEEVKWLKNSEKMDKFLFTILPWSLSKIYIKGLNIFENMQLCRFMEEKVTSKN